MIKYATLCKDIHFNCFIKIFQTEYLNLSLITPDRVSNHHISNQANNTVRTYYAKYKHRVCVYFKFQRSHKQSLRTENTIKPKKKLTENKTFKFACCERCAFPLIYRHCK